MNLKTIIHLRHTTSPRSCGLFVALLAISFQFVALVPAHAVASLDWLDLVKRGQNSRAAEILTEKANNLPSGSSGEFQDLLLSTANSLTTTCRENSKITLFRGLDSQSSSSFVRSGELPLFLSRTLLDKSGLYYPIGLTMSRKKHIYQAMKDHARSTRESKDSPFLSTSYSAYVASLSDTVLVLKICPDRALFNEFSTHHDEFEVLVPFFIHPSEIFAMIQPEDGNHKNVFGDFEILLSGEASGDLNEAEKRKWIIDAIKKNKKLISKSSSKDFGSHFEKMITHKKRYMRRKSNCSEILR